MGDAIFVPHCCKNVSPLDWSLWSRRPLTAHRTMEHRVYRCCRHCPQASTLQSAEFSSNASYLHSQQHLAVSDLACFPCSWHWHLNHHKKRWQPFQISHKNSGVHGNQVLCGAQLREVLVFFVFEGLINIGINPQLLAQGPDQRFVHSCLTTCWSTEDSRGFFSHSFMSRLDNLQGADDFLQMHEMMNGFSSYKLLQIWGSNHLLQIKE